MNVRAVQRLLNLLGQDIPEDGLDGPKTQAALANAIEALGGESEGSFWEEIPNFRRGEFGCKCGRFCDGFPVEPEEGLVRLAQQVRTAFGAPVTVTSGVRCQCHNANVGGVANSRHLLGKAVDFSVRGASARQVLDYVQSLPGVRYAYAIDAGHVHMDVA